MNLNIRPVLSLLVEQQNANDRSYHGHLLIDIEHDKRMQGLGIRIDDHRFLLKGEQIEAIYRMYKETQG